MTFNKKHQTQLALLGLFGLYESGRSSSEGRSIVTTMSVPSVRNLLQHEVATVVPAPKSVAESELSALHHESSLLRRRELASCTAPGQSYTCSLQKEGMEACSQCCWFDSTDLSVFSATTSTFANITNVLKKCYNAPDEATSETVCYCGPQPPVEPPTTTTPETVSGTCYPPGSEFDCSVFNVAGADDACPECCWYDVDDFSVLGLSYSETTTDTKTCHSRGSTDKKCYCGPLSTTSGAGQDSSNGSNNGQSPAVNNQFADCTLAPGDSFDCSLMGDNKCGGCCPYDMDTNQYSKDWNALAKPDLQCHKVRTSQTDPGTCYCGPSSLSQPPADTSSPPPAVANGECTSFGEEFTCASQCGTCCYYNKDDTSEEYSDPTGLDPDFVKDFLVKTCMTFTTAEGVATCKCGSTQHGII